jgi:pyruvate carboxylase subunit B
LGPGNEILTELFEMLLLFDKYKIVTNEAKDLDYGLSGKTPTEVGPEVHKKVLNGYKRGDACHWSGC